jgi:hypothetical protein
VCFEHPDGALRGQVELLRPIRKGVVHDAAALEGVLRAVFAPFRAEIEAAGFLVATAKAHSPAADRASVARALFDSINVPEVNFLAEVRHTAPRLVWLLTYLSV